MITLNDIRDFLGSHNYDLRISGNGRWIDQKCTPDVLWSVSDFVREFAENHPGEFFNATSIWNSEYARQTIAETFSKPDTTEESAANEYDKVFSQPL